MKKCALINDLSGFGKCSLGAGIPIISALGAEAHPLPTAILSNQTSYDTYVKVSMTEYMQSFLDEWGKIGASFDGVLTGYFAEEKQVDIVLKYVQDKNFLLLVDPVMGDGGEKYDGFSDALCSKIKQLAEIADVVTPNATELEILTGESDAEKGAKILLSSGVKAVIVTGIKNEDKIGCAVYTNDKNKIFLNEYIEGDFSGTGDIFASIVMGKLLSGNSVFDAAKAAAEFISTVIKNTKTANRNNGVDFEKYLGELIL